MSLYIGLLSGTSADGIDAALVHITPEQTRLVEHHSQPFAPAQRERIHALCEPGDNEIERAGALDTELGEQFALAANQLMDKAGVTADQITAIGSHGQTIRHRPPEPGRSAAFSWQIGDANIIAARTGVTTVADFRRRDLALGGQGAPLVPAFHQHAFGHPQTPRAVINIGGIGNVSWLAPGQPPLGFDTGPGNGLMDAWIGRHRGAAYDADGAWAASGRTDAALLERLLAHPYLARPAPKSTGREDFHLEWLDRQLARMAPIAPADVQATLLAFTVQTLEQHLRSQCAGFGEASQVYVCGGGAANGRLMAALQERLAPAPVQSTTALGIDPDWVEASAFAWLAYRRLEGLAGNLPSATGARQAAPLGAVYPGA